MTNINQRFIKGLEEYNLTIEELKDWKYCGGNRQQRHINYWKMTFIDKEFPPHKKFCICGHEIKENCYICKNETILTLGNCCIKRFIPSSCRTCEKCGEAHRNRKQNRCNNCFDKKCSSCGIDIEKKYTKCWECQRIW